jgi:four helix bundle suffix protein
MTKENNESIYPKHGGYRDLKSFQSAEIIYDATVDFCRLYIDPYSRTTDQMIQAARSGRQNIAEGSQASATSKKMEITLTNVAKASLEELLLDYEDFLRQRDLPLWSKDSKNTQKLRQLAYVSSRSYTSHYKPCINHSPSCAANTVICLIHQTTYLLRQQLLRLEAEFLENGGFSERLRNARRRHRNG